jgi:hypothetical protein
VTSATGRDRFWRRKTISRVLLASLLFVAVGLYAGWGSPDLLNGAIGGLIAGSIVLGLLFAAERMTRRKRGK